MTDAHFEAEHDKSTLIDSSKRDRSEVLLGVNVDFWRFAGRVLHDEEHFGDELDHVARLKDEVAFPPVSNRRRLGRRRLERQAARL